MTAVCIVQARMGSTRLPGKVLLDLGGKPVLEHVLMRCKRITGINTVILAVPNDAANEPLAQLASGLGCQVYPGSEDNVLERYYWAAKRVRADVVMRITADCPLIDSRICSKVLNAQSGWYNYISNVAPRTFPHGLDCEVFTFEALESARKQATSQYDLEHVTPWMRQNIAGARRANYQCTPGTMPRAFDVFNGEQLKQQRWTLDFPEDLDFLRALVAAGPTDDMENTLETLAEHPELSKINAMRMVA